MERKWCVYKHTSPNGKVYIGITSKAPEKRWSGGAGYCYNKHFWNSIKKYGWENFKHEIVYDKLTKEEACMFEQWLIIEYKSNQFKYGFNQAAGGGGGRYGIPFTEEDKLKRSKAIICTTTGKQYVSAVEAGKDLGISTSGIGKCLKGRGIQTHGYQFKYVNECNDQIREVYIPHNAKAVIEIDSNTEFESVQKASEYYGLSKSCVRDVCIGRIGQTKGHKFRYKDSEYLYKPKQRAGKVKIKNLDTGEVFKSLSEAERKYNANRNVLTTCCRGLIDKAYGYRWAYAS